MGASMEFPIDDHEFCRCGCDNSECKYCVECNEQGCFHWSEWSDEQKVKFVYPEAEIVGYSHGKVRVEVLRLSVVLGVMGYLGTREQRRAAAWKSAAERLPEREI